MFVCKKSRACNFRDDHPSLPSLWRPEYAAYMIEGTPGTPYGSSLAALNKVESNMRRRRSEAQKQLGDNETVLCFTAFPRFVI